MKKLISFIAVLFIATTLFAQSGYDFVIIPGKTYKIGKTEVTQKFYESVMGENPSIHKDPNMPVENVSWFDAASFCNKLSIMHGREPVYLDGDWKDVEHIGYVPHKGTKYKGKIIQNDKADGYRLPSHDEWAYASRGGEFFTFAGSDDLDEVAWHYLNGGWPSHPVAQKKPNGYGLYDMNGNVMEWCNNRTKTFEDNRYITGGDYTTLDEFKFSATYSVDVPASYRADNIGIRLCASLSGEELEAAQKEIEAKKNELLNNLDNYFVEIPGKAYKMGKTEVTQELYEAVIGANPSFFALDCLPVENVSWYDAIYFCNKLSVMKGKEPVYAVDGITDSAEWNYEPHHEKELRGNITQNTLANGYRLPDEAEWEYAAKGGENFIYSGSDDMNEVAWCYENSNRKTHPVALKKPNAYGLYDMTGNVCEWVWSDFSEGHLRGGSYSENDTWETSHLKIWEVTTEGRIRANFMGKNIGFRLLAPQTESYLQ